MLASMLRGTSATEYLSGRSFGGRSQVHLHHNTRKIKPCDCLPVRRELVKGDADPEHIIALRLYVVRILHEESPNADWYARRRHETALEQCRRSRCFPSSGKLAGPDGARKVACQLAAAPRLKQDSSRIPQLNRSKPAPGRREEARSCVCPRRHHQNVDKLPHYAHLFYVYANNSRADLVCFAAPGYTRIGELGGNTVGDPRTGCRAYDVHGDTNLRHTPRRPVNSCSRPHRC